MGNDITEERQKDGFRVPWFKHETGNASDPCIRQLINETGFEGYGRYMALNEMLGNAHSHHVPKDGEAAASAYASCLGFESRNDFNSFLSYLHHLGLLIVDESGHYRSPTIDAAAEGIAKKKASGRKGGQAAARNRRGGKRSIGGIL